jgi:hypothetical protein
LDIGGGEKGFIYDSIRPLSELTSELSARELYGIHQGCVSCYANAIRVIGKGGRSINSAVPVVWTHMGVRFTALALSVDR